MTDDPTVSDAMASIDQDSNQSHEGSEVTSQSQVAVPLTLLDQVGRGFASESRSGVAQPSILIVTATHDDEQAKPLTLHSDHLPSHTETRPRVPIAVPKVFSRLDGKDRNTVIAQSPKNRVRLPPTTNIHTNANQAVNTGETQGAAAKTSPLISIKSIEHQIAPDQVEGQMVSATKNRGRVAKQVDRQTLPTKT